MNSPKAQDKLEQDAQEYGERIREARKEMRLSQGEAAHLARVSLSTWSKVERGVEPPYQQRVLRAMEEVVFGGSSGGLSQPTRPGPMTAAEYLRRLADELEGTGVKISEDVREAIRRAATS